MSKTDSFSEEKIRAEDASMSQQRPVADGQRTTRGRNGRPVSHVILSTGQVTSAERGGPGRNRHRDAPV